jgi:membrane protease YdiL (CAAX protease family)
LKASVPGGVLVVGYLAVVLTAGSMLAWLVHGVIDYEYSRVLSRSVLLIAGLGLLPVWRLAGLDAGHVGLKPVVLRHVAAAYPIGIAVVAPLMLVFLVVDYRFADPRVDYLGSELLMFIPIALVSGILVGIFEETLFRGVLFGAMRHRFAFAPTAVAVSFVYALVHFLDRSALDVDAVAWYSGFETAMNALRGLSYPPDYWDSFVALFLLGALFCWVRERVGLWWCIGLHASWVFAIRLFKEVTMRDELSPYAELVGAYDHFVGHLVSVWLIFIFVLLALYRRAKDY